MNAVLTLCKLMCVSSEFCERNLQLLLTVLERSNYDDIRSNVVIALGDVAVCFNSLIDENIGYLYNRLHDNCLSVRTNTMMVLSHLILNGMIKVKGQIAEMAKCIEDEQPRLSDLAKVFIRNLLFIIHYFIIHYLIYKLSFIMLIFFFFFI
jgi:condensin complex subunit 1